MPRYRCPPDEVPVIDPNDDRPLKGCGSAFRAEPDPDDGWVDCPHCGLMFNPDHDENKAWQP